MKRLYILFSDIRGHTEWSERHSPQQLIDLLSNYYASPKNNCVHMNTSSDEILMFFDNVEYAMRAAKRLYMYSQELKEKEKLSIGIALHVGEVEKLVYQKSHVKYKTYVGHSISVGKRLENLCAGSEIIISEDVYNDLPEEEKNNFKSTIEVSVKGKRDPIKIYLLEGKLRV